MDYGFSTMSQEYVNDVRVSGRVRADAQGERCIVNGAFVPITIFDLVQRVVINPTRSILRVIPCVVVGVLQPAALREIKGGMDLMVNGELVSPSELTVKVRVTVYRTIPSDGKGTKRAEKDGGSESK